MNYIDLTKGFDNALREYFNIYGDVYIENKELKRYMIACQNHFVNDISLCVDCLGGCDKCDNFKKK